MQQRESGISFVVLTYNEEKHIARCIRSLQAFAEEVWVVDSFSTDRTVEIAEQLGARTVKHPFENQAQQFNWAIRNCDIRGAWIWRVDADEYISENCGRKVQETIATCAADVNGIYVNKAIVFQGRKLRHGGWYPAQLIKVIRKGFGESETGGITSFAFPSTYNTTDGSKFYTVGSSYSYDTGEYEYYIKTIDPKTNQLTDGIYCDAITEKIKGLTAPYELYVSPYTGNVYFTDAGNYASAGTLYGYKPDGQPLFAPQELYVNPAHILALPVYE